jgi:hypothetical protein
VGHRAGCTAVMSGVAFKRDDRLERTGSTPAVCRGKAEIGCLPLQVIALAARAWLSHHGT